MSLDNGAAKFFSHVLFTYIQVIYRNSASVNILHLHIANPPILSDDLAPYYDYDDIITSPNPKLPTVILNNLSFTDYAPQEVTCRVFLEGIIS